MQSKRTNARRIIAEVIQFCWKSCYVDLANIFFTSPRWEECWRKKRKKNELM